MLVLQKLLGPLFPFFIIICVKVQEHILVRLLEFLDALFIDYDKDRDQKLRSMGIHKHVLTYLLLVNQVAQILLQERRRILFDKRGQL